MVRQLDYGYASAALSPISQPERLDQRMSGQSLMYRLPQYTRSLAVDDTHGWQPGHESGIKVLVELGQGYMYPHPPYTQLGIDNH
jgi:hypothetical protein